MARNRGKTNKFITNPICCRRWVGGYMDKTDTFCMLDESVGSGSRVNRTAGVVSVILSL
jgi:hypothetical protein